MENGVAIVVGGGVIGLCCAIALQREGLRVSLVEPQGDWRGASWGNAGHIAIEQTAPLASWATIASAPRRLFINGGALALPLSDVATWAPFAVRMLAAAAPSRFQRGQAALTELLSSAAPDWQSLLGHMGRPELFAMNGHLVTWETTAGAVRGRRAWLGANVGTAAVQDLRPVDRRLLAIALPKGPVDGLHFAGTGQIADPDQLAHALWTAFRDGGGIPIQHGVQRMTRADGGVRLTLTNGAEIVSNRIILAAGARSAELLRPLGLNIPMIAERGYHLEAPVSEAQWPSALPPVVFEERSLIATRFQTKLRIASFVEFAHVDSPPDPRKWARLHQHAAQLKLPIPPDAARWMGARPTLPDYLPVLGPVEGVPGLFAAFGHQHLGLTLAAVTGRLIAGSVAGRDVPAAFSASRFM